MAPLQDAQSQTILFACDTFRVKPEFISQLKKCRDATELRKAIGKQDFTVVENKDKTVFVFMGTERMRQYLDLRQSLYTFAKANGAGDHDKEWQSLPKLKQLPTFFYDYVSALAQYSSSIKLSQDQSIEPSLSCSVTLKSGDDKITFTVHMSRTKSERVRSLWEGTPATPVSIDKNELEQVMKDFRERIDQPSVLYRSDRLEIFSWGPPWANSRYADLVKRYFEQLQWQTEKIELLVSELNSNFLQGLANGDIHWKILADARDKQFSDLDKTSQDFIRLWLNSNTTVMESSLINSEAKLNSFLASAKVSQVRANVSILASFLGANGSRGNFGFQLP